METTLKGGNNMINELLLTATLLSNNVTYLYAPKGSVITVYTNTEISSAINVYGNIYEPSINDDMTELLG